MSVRCALVLVLAISTIGKVWHRSELAEFGDTLRMGLRLPRARLVAGAWVAVEGITAIALALPVTVADAAVLAVGVFGCLTAGAALLVAQHRGFACNCFGAKQSRLSWRTVLRNGGLTAAALLLAVGLRLRGAAAAPPAPVLLAAVLTVLLGAVLIWQAGPLGVLLRQSAIRHQGSRPVTPRSALSGGRR
ncbi:MauE/DoxX family redox-associated membrane protein [Jatrophihabitans sp.]|jgi:membrane-bound metal-dependent hydrolase YbcI (DUF457 family)|uniref:MauE/DoxX family redox-associated membrane protein n=1 Tax=Jatrophihabitans sp. TaxID=1932789 RepID=UPI002EEEA7EE